LFYNGKGLEGLRNYTNVQFTLGNFGFSKTVCSSNYIELDGDVTVSCQTGYIQSLLYAGIIPTDSADALGYAYCGNSEDMSDISACTASSFNSTYFESDFAETCTPSD